MINSYAGPKVLLSEELPKEQDWSLCRSPSRAKRRYRQGHKQYMRWVETPYAIMAGKTAIVTAAMYGRLLHTQRQKTLLLTLIRTIHCGRKIKTAQVGGMSFNPTLNLSQHSWLRSLEHSGHKSLRQSPGLSQCISFL